MIKFILSQTLVRVLRACVHTASVCLGVGGWVILEQDVDGGKVSLSLQPGPGYRHDIVLYHQPFTTQIIEIVVVL